MNINFIKTQIIKQQPNKKSEGNLFPWLPWHSLWRHDFSYTKPLDSIGKISSFFAHWDVVGTRSILRFGHCKRLNKSSVWDIVWDIMLNIFEHYFGICWKSFWTSLWIPRIGGKLYRKHMETSIFELCFFRNGRQEWPVPRQVSWPASQRKEYGSTCFNGSVYQLNKNMSILTSKGWKS